MKRSLVALAALLTLPACSDLFSSSSGSQAPPSQVASMMSDGGRKDEARNGVSTAELDEIRSSKHASARTGAPRELLDRIPKGSLFVLRLPHLELLDETWDRTAVAQSMKNMPGLPPGVDPLDIAFGELRNASPAMGDLLDLLPEIEGELLIALTSLDANVDVGEAPFTAMVLLDVGHHAGKLKRALEPALRSMSELPGFERHRNGWGFDAGDHQFRASVHEEAGLFTARVGHPEGVERLKEGLHTGSFLTSALVASTPDYEAEEKPVVLEAFLHTKALWEATRPMMPIDVQQVLEAAGMFGVEGAAATMALDERGLAEALTWCSPGHGDLISRALSAKPINGQLAKLVPRSVDNASIVSFDVGTAFGDVIRVLPEGTRDMLFDRLGEMEQATGANLREDLFENFGPTMLCLADGSPEEWMMRAAPKIATVVEIEDAAGAQRVVAAIKRATAGMARVSTSRYGDAEVTAFLVASGDLPMPIKISVAITDGLAVVSADEALMKEVLDAKRFPLSDSKLATELAGAGPRAWCVATSKPAAKLPTMTAVGTTVGDGLRLEASSGSGSLVLGGLAGGLAIPAAVAIPKLLSSRVSANEASAIAMLRSIASAQAHARSSVIVDADRDGKGEALLLHELTGSANVRGTGRPLTPVLLTSNWQQAAPGTASKAGYVFRVDVPAARGGGTCVSREPNGSDISTDGAERAWIAYAWPLERGNTGTRAFAIDQSGTVWATDNRGSDQDYSGFGNGPAFDAFFSSEKDGTAPFEGRDGGYWQRVE